MIAKALNYIQSKELGTKLFTKLMPAALFVISND